jgi:hypothetical protein
VIKVKKLLFFLIAFLAVSLSEAAVNAPRDTRGESLHTIDFVGAIPCNVDISTGTNAVRCGSAERGVVFGVIASSLAAGNYVVLRDSNTANTSSTVSTTIFADDPGADEGGDITMIHKFPVPIRFLNGISVNASAAPTGAGRWTILYRPLNAAE